MENSLVAASAVGHTAHLLIAEIVSLSADLQLAKANTNQGKIMNILVLSKYAYYLDYKRFVRMLVGR